MHQESGQASVFSKNFFGEILFDYLLTHYENNIYYVSQLVEKQYNIPKADK